MNKKALTAIVFIITLCAACKNGGNTGKANLQGKWKGKTEGTSLQITKKQFIIDSDKQNPEDYFVKGDTIFTSFEGNQPYTKFIIRQLDDHNLHLLFPDSVLVEYTR